MTRTSSLLSITCIGLLLGCPGDDAASDGTGNGSRTTDGGSEGPDPAGGVTTADGGETAGVGTDADGTTAGSGPDTTTGADSDTGMGEDSGTDTGESDTEQLPCGNGELDPDEECDFGEANGAACSSRCTIEPCAWDTDAVPLPHTFVGDAYWGGGGVTFDAQCNIVIGWGTEYVQVAGDTGMGSVIGSNINPPTALPSSFPAYDPATGTVYIGTSGVGADESIEAIRADGTHEVVGLEGALGFDVPGAMTCLRWIPESVEGIGGQLLMCKNGIVLVDPEAMTSNNIVLGPSEEELLTSATVTPDGTIYAAATGLGIIYELSDMGEWSVFHDFEVTGGVTIGSIVSSSDGSRLYATYSDGPWSGQLVELTIPDAQLTVLDPDVFFDISFQPDHAMLVDANDQLMFLDSNVSPPATFMGDYFLSTYPEVR